MTKSNDKSGSRLRKTKKHNSKQFRHFKDNLAAKLIPLEEQLYNLLHSQIFFQEAMLALSADQNEPEPWLPGALLTQESLRHSSDDLVRQYANVREWIREYS